MLTVSLHSTRIVERHDTLIIIDSTTLRTIKDVLLIISSRFGDEEMVVPTFPTIIEMRAKKEFDETKLNLSIYNNSKMKRVALTENELNGVPP